MHALARRPLLALSVALAALAPAAALADQVVTVYSADGLHDGHPSWFQTEFDAFTQATGIKVQYVEAGSGVVVQRIARERANPQADVLVTLPPFINAAASDGLLQRFVPSAAAHIPASLKDRDSMYVALCNDYMNFIYNAKLLKQPPTSFKSLLDSQYKGKIQYSTPGEAGDGTAVMIQAFHAFGGKDKGFDYLKALQANNVGPSSSTGKLTALVNKGELLVANGDLQMNVDQIRTNPNVRVFWPESPDGRRETFALPYDIALVHGAPHAAAGRKLIDFLLSRQAQAKLPSLAFGIPVRDDVKSDDANSKLLAGMLKGVTVWTPDWYSIERAVKADVARWHDVTGS